MPHFHIDYSANLETVLDIAQLCEVIRATAAEIETFPMAGIRVRAMRADHVAIAGRTEAVKQDAITRVFAALKDFAAPAMATHSIALSAEIRDIDADLSPKFGNIRDHLEDNA